MHEEARPSTSEVQNPSRVLTKCASYKSKQCRGGLNGTTQADLPQISANANQTQLLLLVGRARSSIVQDGVKRAASKEKKKKKCKYCIVLLHKGAFEKYHRIRNY
jgi:hypothetical protein